MAILQFLIAWANAPFTIAAGIAMGFALLSATGLLGLLGGSEDGEANHEVEHELDHELDHEVDGEGDDEVDTPGIGAIFLVPLGMGDVFNLISISRGS